VQNPAGAAAAHISRPGGEGQGRGQGQGQEEEGGGVREPRAAR